MDRIPTGEHYGRLIHRHVSRKWPTPELKEWWYAKFTMSLRKKLIKLHRRQEGKCCFCGIETWLSVKGIKKQNPPPGMKMKQMATADHKIPQSQGGTNRMSNLAMACTLCNNERQTTPFEEFMEVRQDPIKWRERNRKLTAQYQQRSGERKVKSQARKEALVWKLALLFYVYPGMYEIAKNLPNPPRGRRPSRKVVDDSQTGVRQVG